MRGNAQYYGELLLYTLVLFAFQYQLNLVEKRSERKFWNYLTLAFASWLAARCAIVLVPETLENEMRYIWVDVVYLIYYLFLFLAAEIKPDLQQEQGSDPPSEKIKLLGFIAFLTTLLTCFILIPSDLAPQDYEVLLPSHYLYVALDLVVLLRFFELRRISRSHKWRTIYGLIALSTLQFLLLDIMEWFIYAGIMQDPWGAKMDLIWGLPLATIVLAARIRHLPLSTVEIEAHRRSVVPKSPLVLLTFLLLAIHFLVSYFDVFGAAAKRAQEVAIFFGFIGLGTLAILEDSRLRKRAELLELERKNAEKREVQIQEQLAQSQRMEAIGLLAGGVAHDFNNLLTVILCNVELLNLQIEPGAGLKKPAEAIEKAALHAASLTRQLLAFSRKQFLSAQIIDLNFIVARHGRYGSSLDRGEYRPKSSTGKRSW